MARRTDRRVPLVRCADARRRRQADFSDDVYQPLKLLDERRFGNGMVFLRYTASRRVTGGRGAANMEAMDSARRRGSVRSGGGYRP